MTYYKFSIESLVIFSFSIKNYTRRKRKTMLIKKVSHEELSIKVNFYI